MSQKTAQMSTIIQKSMFTIPNYKRNALVIREMQIKTTLRYHLTLVRMVIIKNLETTGAGEDVKK